MSDCCVAFTTKSSRNNRDWRQFYNPKDLAISISLETAELLEVFQWSGADTSAEGREDKIREELADVLIYCLLLSGAVGSTRCGSWRSPRLSSDILDKRIIMSKKSVIVRELVSNTLIHHEFVSPRIATVAIDQDDIRARNASRALCSGPVDLENLDPTPKNPIIARVFTQKGRSEKLGTPEARRDLSVSLGRLGDPARDRGDLCSAEGLYARSLGLDEPTSPTRYSRSWARRRRASE